MESLIVLKYIILCKVQKNPIKPIKLEERKDIGKMSLFYFSKKGHPSTPFYGRINPKPLQHLKFFS